jgi:hypothetical protein
MDLASGRLGWTIEGNLFSRPLLGCHVTGVLSSSQTVGANVGVRLPKAIELQRERKKELEQERESGTESKANNCSKSHPLRSACAGLYRGGQGSHYNALNALNHLPCQ